MDKIGQIMLTTECNFDSDGNPYGFIRSGEKFYIIAVKSQKNKHNSL